MIATNLQGRNSTDLNGLLGEVETLLKTKYLWSFLLIELKNRSKKAMMERENDSRSLGKIEVCESLIELLTGELEKIIKAELNNRIARAEKQGQNVEQKQKLQESYKKKVMGGA